MSFETTNLLVRNWTPVLADQTKRKVLENELKRILTPKITRYLPLSMQFSADYDLISEWIEDRTGEAEILCVHRRDVEKLAGLIVLADEAGQTDVPTIHLGYFFGEKFWGKGYATEAISGLNSALAKGPQVRLVAGVDSENAASVRVLEKSGFRNMPEQSTAGQLFFEKAVG